jgi:Co/Zn/Cd efflux system component
MDALFFALTLCSCGGSGVDFELSEEYRLRLQVALKRVVVIMCLFTVGLFASAWMARSLLLASTAVHMLIDIGTYACNLWANTHALRRFEELRRETAPSTDKAFVAAAEINATILSRSAFDFRLSCQFASKTQCSGAIMFVAVGVVAEACHRLQGTMPPRVFGGLMFGVSLVSIVVQGVCFAMLQPFDGAEVEKMNLRSALLHLASDLTLGVAVIAASSLVYFLNWQHADDWASIICCVIFIYMCGCSCTLWHCTCFSRLPRAGLQP